MDEEVLPWAETAWCWRAQRRWWSRHSLLREDGCLTLGYTRPFERLAESYIAHTSPYWLGKIWLALRQPSGHPFWSGPEQVPGGRPDLLVLPTCGGVLAGTRDHPVLLLTGQYGPEWMEAAGERYGKFAYDTRHGFHLPAPGEDPTPDNALLVRRAGTGRWTGRAQPLSWSVGTDGCRVEWSPLPGIHIETRLLPLHNGHLREHRITTDHEIETVEGGFPDGTVRDPDRPDTPVHRVRWGENLLHENSVIPVLFRTLAPGRHRIRTETGH